MSDLTERLESQLNAQLDPEEIGSIELWEKGRYLAGIINTEGWRVVLEMLQSYATKAFDALIETDPSNIDEVRANHAVAFAAHRIYSSFKQDVASAIDTSVKTPDVVKEVLRRVKSPAPPEMIG